MICRKAIFIIPLLCLSSLCSMGQGDSLIFSAINNPTLKEYNLRKMNADNDGNLWFATDKGVLKYDGNDITVFDHHDNDTNSLSINSCGFLYFDRHGNLYVFEVGAVDYLDTRTGKVQRLAIEMPDSNKSKLAFPYAFSEPFIDADESLWVGVYGVGFLHFNRITGKTQYFTTPRHYDFQAHNVFTIKNSHSNPSILWLATDDGIYSFDKQRQQLHRAFRSANNADSTGIQTVILTMDAANDDSIWFTVPARGIGCYDVKTGIYKMFEDRDKISGEAIPHDITVLTRKNDHEFYIGFGDKLPGIFSTRTLQYSFPAKMEHPLPAVQVRHVLPDTNGNFWSLIYYQLYEATQTKSKFTTISFNDDETHHRQEDVFKATIWDESRNQYLIAFDTKNSISVMDEQMRMLHDLPFETGIANPDLAEPNVMDIVIDHHHRVWACGTFVWLYDEQKKRMVQASHFNKKLALPDARIQNMQARGSYIYLQPANIAYRAIYRIDENTLQLDSIPGDTAIWTAALRVPEFHYQDVLEIDQSGKMGYVAYANDLYQVDLRTGQFKKIVTIRLKPFNHFGNQFWYRLDDHNDLWVSTGEAIFVYNTQTLDLIRKTARKKDTYDIQLQNISGNGIMCILGSEGLTLVDYINNREFKYSLSDGLTTIYNSGVSCVNNTVFVGAIGYLHYRDLASMVKNIVNRKCYLSQILLFNVPYKTDSLAPYLHALNLTHDKNFLTFTFSSTAFEQLERLEYRYRLSQVDKEWVYVNYRNRTISYNGLPPGNYVFEASIRNADGSWSGDGVNLRIHIDAAWWQTAWFKLLATAMAILLIAILVSWRVRSVRKNERERAAYEKERLELEAKALRSQMNPHFIFNSLNSIKSLINKNESETAAGYLTTFSKLIRTLFQNSDKREISLHEELETCRLYTELEVMRFANKVEFIFDIDEHLDTKDVKIPALVLQPFIENAIWHGLVPKESGGRVTVSVRKRKGGVECVIDDDGIGREISQQNNSQLGTAHQSRGIGLTQLRLELDKRLNDREDSIEIIDKYNEEGAPAGTTVIINFKEKDA